MKVYRHKVEAELRAEQDNTKVKMVNAGWHQVDGKVSLNTAFKGKNLQEACKMLFAEFNLAAAEFGVDVKDVIIEKGRFGEKAYLTATRKQTAEERERDFQANVDAEVRLRRRKHQNKKNAEYNKKREIKKLQDQLEELQK